jgi:hypothetical protein
MSSDNESATIANNANHYAFKVSGGTITPKRAEHLTIPLIAEARGLYASVYQQNTGRKLFRPKGKNVLMESTGKGTARAVYALVKQVTMGPWPRAVPDDDVIADAFVDQWKLSLADIIERS